MLLLAMLLGADDVESAMREATQVSPEQGRALIDRWIAAHAGSTDVPRARLWQAHAYVRESRYAEADALLGELAAGSTDTRWDAALLRADLELMQRHWATAEERYASLGAPVGSRWELEAHDRLTVARSAGLREGLVWWVAVSLMLLVGYRAIAVRGSLWPPPEEVRWSAPVLAVMMLGAAPRPVEERAAIFAIGLGGVALLWVNGAYLRARALRRWRRVAEVLLGAAQAAAALYCAIIAAGLWEPVANTFAAGVE